MAKLGLDIISGTAVTDVTVLFLLHPGVDLVFRLRSPCRTCNVHMQRDNAYVATGDGRTEQIFVG